MRRALNHLWHVHLTTSGLIINSDAYMLVANTMSGPANKELKLNIQG